MVGAKHVLARVPRRVWPAAATACSLLVLLAGASGARAALVGSFQTLASSPEPLTSVTVDPTTNIIYAQGFEDTTFYKYAPTTNTWTALPPAPLNSGNNGGAAYLNGKIYTAYTDDAATLGVYDIASESWSTIANPLGLGTGNITAVGGLLYLVEANSLVSYDPATATTTTLASVPNFTGDCSGEGFSPWGGLQPFGGEIYGTQGDGCNGFAGYNIASNTWTLLPDVPNDTVLGSALDPVTGTFFAYGSYGGSSFDSYEIASNSWSTTTFPFSDIDDGGMAYVSAPGLQGVYAIEGQENPGFTRYFFAQDVGVTTSASPLNATAGYPALLSSVVSNAGPTTSDITFTDHVPAGLTIESVTVGSGACSTSGQVVTCKITGLSTGQSAAANIIVTPGTAGSYTNSVSAEPAPGVPETNPANNSASATLHVAAVPAVAPPAKCVVPNLKGTPVTVAEHVLSLLNCKVGKVRHAHSKHVRKGTVVKTSPKPGTYTAHEVVLLQVSSGPKKKKTTHPHRTSGLG